MTKLLLFAFVILLLLPSCKDDKSEEHLSREKMIDLLTDIHIAEVYSSMAGDSLHRVLTKNIDSVAVYYKSILNHHNLSLEEFRNSLDWYSHNPAEMDSVYIGIQNKLITMESVVGSPKEEDD